MMSLTHTTIAAAGVSLILGTADSLAFGLAILGSQFPDDSHYDHWFCWGWSHDRLDKLAS